MLKLKILFILAKIIKIARFVTASRPILESNREKSIEEILIFDNDLCINLNDLKIQNPSPIVCISDDENRENPSDSKTKESELSNLIMKDFDKYKIKIYNLNKEFCLLVKPEFLYMFFSLEEKNKEESFNLNKRVNSNDLDTQNLNNTDTSKQCDIDLNLIFEKISEDDIKTINHILSKYPLKNFSKYS